MSNYVCMYVCMYVCNFNPISRAFISRFASTDGFIASLSASTLPERGGTTYIHKYIIVHYNSSVRIMDSFSHRTCCEWPLCPLTWDLLFNVNSEWQIFEKLFYDMFIYSQRAFARNLLRWKWPRKYFLHISFCYLTWDMNLGFISNKTTHYIPAWVGRLQKIKNRCIEIWRTDSGTYVLSTCF